MDHDGLVEPRDIVSMYGTHITIEYADLVKIMESVNSKADGSGRLNYNDFSRWMGNEIHNLASFIFRHDSKRNPDMEMYLKEQERRKGPDRAAAAATAMHQGDVLPKLIEKIRQRWATVRKAFKEFNEDNDPYIDRAELYAFLVHWGFPIDEAQTDTVFAFFDKDKDGRISYQDFV